MMTAADPRAPCRQHLVCAPVNLPTPAGRSGLNIWRSSTEQGRGGSQSWAQESSAEGLHQLHGSIVLERGREEAGTGDDSCWGKGAGKGLSHLPGPRTHRPRPRSTLHPPSLAVTPHSPGGPRRLNCCLLPHQSGPTPSFRSAKRTLPQPGQARPLPSDRWPEGTGGILPTLLPTPHTQEPWAHWPPCSCPKSRERGEGEGGVQG